MALVVYTMYTRKSFIFVFFSLFLRVFASNSIAQDCGAHVVLGALPGNGWDNFNNVEMNSVLKMNFSECHMSDDLSLVYPNDMLMIPVKKSELEFSSILIDHFTNYKSSESTTINAKTSFGFWKMSASASFTKEYTRVKEQTVQDKTMVSRSLVSYHLFTLLANPSMELDDGFKDRLMDIAYSIQEDDNNTARYNAERLVADYGTHYINRVHLGGHLVQEDMVSSEYVRELEKKGEDVRTKAGASFFSAFKFDFSTHYHKETEDIEVYNKNCKDSRLQTHGGDLFRTNQSIDHWANTIKSNLAVIDRDGDPLSALVSHERLPGLPETLIRELSFTIQKAIEAYYQYNTYPGCTDVNSLNFDYIANVEDGTCTRRPNNYTFGGVYQTCTGSCAGRTQVNPQTGKFLCPDGYSSQLLQTVNVPVVERKCKRNWVRKKKCHDDYSQSYTYSMYWCAATQHVPANTGYLYGGAFTSRTTNILTGTRGCPEDFTAISIGGDDKITVCLSDDYEFGWRRSMPFSGFFSCSSGNPLAQEATVLLRARSDGLQSLAMYNIRSQAESGSVPKACPEGYSQHLLTINEGCAIHYCSNPSDIPNLKGELPTLRKPPYGSKPTGYDGDEVRVVFSSVDGQVWMKGPKDSAWHEAAQTDASIVEDYEDDNTTVIALSVCLGIVGLVLVAVAVVTWRMKRNRPYHQQALGEDESRPLIGDGYGSTEDTHGDLDEVCQE